MSTMRRVYFYGVAFVALVVAAVGASFLLRYLLDLVLGRQLGGAVSEQVAAGLAALLVGTPLWLLHWGLAQRQVAQHPQEAGAVLRKLYVYAAMFVAVTIAFAMARSLLSWAFGVEPFSATWPAFLVVWGGVWAYHWATERREGQPSPGARMVGRWYVYVVSGYSLVFFASGVMAVLAVLLGRAYDGLVGPPPLRPGPDLWGEQVRAGLAGAIAGGVWWAFHWLYLARGDAESTLRQVYLYIFAFLGGAVVVLASVAVLLYAVLRWVLGAPGVPPAGEHFRVVPQMLPLLLVGLAALGYHWGVAQEESRRLAGRLPGARRSFGYIVSALGLGTLVSGVSLLLGALIGLIIPAAREPIADMGAWRNPLALGLTLLVIGAPPWLWYWTRMQRQAQAGGLEERGALSRRIFVYGVLGVLALAALGSLVGFLTVLLTDLLEGRFALTFLREGKWLLAVALTAGGFLGYYWQVLREDQRVGAEAAPGRKQVTLVVGAEGEVLAAQLQETLGARLRVLRVVAPEATAPTLSPEEVAAVAERVRVAPTDHVLLVAADGAVRVYAYR